MFEYLEMNVFNPKTFRFLISGVKKILFDFTSLSWTSNALKVMSKVQFKVTVEYHTKIYSFSMALILV